MLRSAIVLLIVALALAAIGFTEWGGAFSGLAKLLFYVAAAACLIAGGLALTGRVRPR